MASYSSSRSRVVIYVSDERTSTRFKFTSYVCDALDRERKKLHKEIEYFNEDTVRKGVVRFREIKKIIKDSWISIVIISEAYATKDCLDQLLIILEEKREKGEAYMVLPVFYLVSPDDVETQIGNFAKLFADLRQKHGAQMAEKWGKALAELVGIGGRVLEPNKSEAFFVTLIIGDVLKHVDWLYAKGIIPVTSSEKSLGVEASVECSKKLIKLGSKGTSECLALKGNRDEGKCIEIECFESQISPPPNLAFRGSLEKLISGEANNCKSDDSRLKNSGSLIISSSKLGSFNKSVLKALLEHQAFFSQDLELGSQNLGDLSNSFQILKGLTEDDGINIVEKSQLSVLEFESAAVIEQIRSFAKGRKEVELEIQKLDGQKEEMEKCYRMMDSHREYLKPEMSAAKSQELYHSLELLKSSFVELENSRDAKLHEQKVQLEELEQQGRQRLRSLQQFIDGLISKFHELAGRDC